MHTLEAITVVPFPFVCSLLLGQWYPSNYLFRTYVLRQTLQITPSASSAPRSTDSSSVRERALA